ncbi:MAG: hypothetical protein QM831_25665 [Kofleriaceae bacterium]
MITAEFLYSDVVADPQSPYRTWIDPARKLHVVDRRSGAELIIEWRYIDRGDRVVVTTEQLVIEHAHVNAFALADIAAMFELAPGKHLIDVELESAMADLLVTVISGVAKADARNLDDLLIELADAPNQEVRTILVDTWNDAGEAFAPAFARQLAGARPDDNALGVLNQFLMYVEYGGGLPRAARVAPHAPTDRATIDLARADRRLGLFRELALGQAHVATYIDLIGSPCAIGLRDVTAPHIGILNAIRDANHHRISTLRDLDLDAVIESLALPVFDNVTDIHVTTPPNEVHDQLDRVIRDRTGFFRRRPRHLHFVASASLHDVIRRAWTDDLPLAGVTAGSLTLRR